MPLSSPAFLRLLPVNLQEVFRKCGHLNLALLRHMPSLVPWSALRLASSPRFVDHSTERLGTRCWGKPAGQVHTGIQFQGKL